MFFYYLFNLLQQFRYPFNMRQLQFRHIKSKTPFIFPSTAVLPRGDFQNSVILFLRRTFNGSHRHTLPLSIQIKLVFGFRPEFLRRVSKKTNFPLTKSAGITGPGPVPSRVKPILENPMSKFTKISLRTAPRSKSRAGHSSVIEPPWVTALRLLATVCIRTFRPIVAAVSWAPLDLVRVHPKLVGAEHRRVVYFFR